jgi:hypothetical protein
MAEIASFRFLAYRRRQSRNLTGIRQLHEAHADLCGVDDGYRPVKRRS